MTKKLKKEIKFEYLVGNEKCYLDTRWESCCCTCANHAEVNKHCCHSPKENNKCVCDEYLGFYVCTALHKMDGSGVNLSGNHGFCELYEEK